MHRQQFGSWLLRTWTNIRLVGQMTWRALLPSNRLSVSYCLATAIIWGIVGSEGYGRL
jgi:hypothetical protein